MPLKINSAEVVPDEQSTMEYGPPQVPVTIAICKPKLYKQLKFDIVAEY